MNKRTIFFIGITLQLLLIVNIRLIAAPGKPLPGEEAIACGTQSTIHRYITVRGQGATAQLAEIDCWTNYGNRRDAIILSRTECAESENTECQGRCEPRIVGEPFDQIGAFPIIYADGSIKFRAVSESWLSAGTVYVECGWDLKIKVECVERRIEKRQCQDPTTTEGIIRGGNI
jgi:hypothetical protein